MDGLLSTLSLIIGAVLIIMGLVLAFFGKLIWSIMMAIIGALLGGLLGYVIGFILLGSWIFAIILSLVFSILGSMLFGYLVEIGLAFVLGLMGFALVYFAVGGVAGIVGGAVVLAIIFAISYYFIEEVVSVATALIGGVVAGIGCFFLGADAGFCIGIGLLFFVCGALVQIFALRRYPMRRR